MKVKELEEIWGCQLTESFKSEKRNLVLDALGNGEPSWIGVIWSVNFVQVMILALEFLRR